MVLLCLPSFQILHWRLPNSLWIMETDGHLAFNNRFEPRSWSWYQASNFSLLKPSNYRTFPLQILIFFLKLIYFITAFLVGSIDLGTIIYLVVSCGCLVGSSGSSYKVCGLFGEALFEHPSVAEVAAVGMPHENLGETVAIAVVFKCLGEHTEVESFFWCLFFFFHHFFGAKQFWSVPYLGDLGDFKHFWWEDYPIWPQTYFQRATQAEKNRGKVLCLQLQKTCSSMPPAYCHGIWWGTYDEMAMVQDSWHGPQGITPTTCALKFGAQTFWPKVKSLKVEVEKKPSDISCHVYPHLCIFFKLLFQRCFHVDQTIWVQAMLQCHQGAFWSLYMGCCPTSRLVPGGVLGENLMWSFQCIGRSHRQDSKEGNPWAAEKAAERESRIETAVQTLTYCDILQAPIVLNAFCAWCSSKNCTQELGHGSWKLWFSSWGNHAFLRLRKHHV